MKYVIYWTEDSSGYNYTPPLKDRACRYDNINEAFKALEYYDEVFKWKGFVADNKD